MSEARRSVLERAFPQLEVASIEPIGTGWDCHTYEVNGEWIVQIPRLADAAETMRKQIGLLGGLAREVSAAVPVPELVSNDPLCMGYRKIPGRPLEVERALEGSVPERLGRFLYDLHMVPPEILGWRPGSPEAWREEYRELLGGFRERVFPLLSSGEREAARALFGSFMDDDANFRFATVVVHRDLGPEHVLMTPGGDLTGVIDWGDAEVGDPAIDFWWLAGHPAFGERMLAAYGGEPDPTFRERARFYYRLGPWHEVTYGFDADRSGFVESGLEAVRERLSS